ncbi:hypothetical protein Ctob_009556 [Chrysochromulina tobinii]|uniref:DUF393 domain-containing protein n=1 Tax=Chrysochromulina tobinii TaxID=1460289 RepID=A0A0M0KBD8_9EUKA|nr:hypothetical protein Ctob_009556 [Chrysochromulina tobinii]|eukprot:KOO36150.1 hypothetical protein Ctob_009556 [Chrysochromulina sp. CCMP291]
MPPGFELPAGRSGIILFDGVCNFCNRVYRLVAENRYSILGKDESGGPESCKLRADLALVAERFLG